jgi:hypothetical protein
MLKWYGFADCNPTGCKGCPILVLLV